MSGWISRAQPRIGRPRRWPRGVAAAVCAVLVAAVLLVVQASPAHGDPRSDGTAVIADANATRIAWNGAAPGSVGTESVPTDEPWRWPTSPVRVVAGFAAPAHDYGAGHRGIDLSAAGEVRAPASGVVAFSGTVVDRPLVTIDHGGGLVSTLEPVSSPLSPGDPITGGDAVGTVSSGGHAPPGAIHFGVRLNGDYINPLLLLGGVPRAVLLPCC
ncbi:murein hydrolase activator EnvC family protein [Microbacterium sp. JB110]|uniref:murein hydrolase activator EnvC family protein n=1 Tax=Microbacterium sp. JB110 TaxID=2024477 RepID=UPI00097F2884|nr:M23 family metallopeptidase [Microbacterium sp. JB110]RCS62770.1 M23 family peptidase [Microbacterium sp. JB110]SJM62873.1 Membrane proteins related to metalloendopeptidases [Frigoribacterium sp. JB110]